jgi:bacillaene synthase trans-acting acyltransferase
VISAQKTQVVLQPDVAHLLAATRGCVDFAGTLRQLEQGGSYLYVDLGPSGSMATAVKYNLGPDSASRQFAVMTPYGNESRQLGKLLEQLGALC